MDDSLPIPPTLGKRADIESEKERMEKGEDMEAGEVTMQMQEYIYLATTPMYFLGASGRIVGRIESPHLPPPRSLSSFSRGVSNPSPLSPSPFFHAILFPPVCMHHESATSRADTREIYEQTSPGPQG